MYELTSGIISATKTLLALSFSSGEYVFTLESSAVKKESSCQQLSLSKDYLLTARPSTYDGIATLRVIVIHSLDLGKLRAYY